MSTYIEEKIQKIAKELKKYVDKNRNKINQENCNELRIKNFLKKRKELTAELRNYAQFLLYDKEIRTPGNCYYCLTDIELILHNKQLLYACSTCAAIITDEADCA